MRSKSDNVAHPDIPAEKQWLTKHSQLLNKIVIPTGA